MKIHSFVSVDRVQYNVRNVDKHFQQFRSIFTVRFVSHSLITTVMLLVHTILMRYLYECRRPVPERLRGVIRVLSRASLADRFAQMGYFVDQVCQWVDSNMIRKKRVIFSTKTQKCTHFVSSMVTVESQIRVDRATNVYEDWQRLAAAVDRLMLPVVVVAYILM